MIQGHGSHAPASSIRFDRRRVVTAAPSAILQLPEAFPAISLPSRGLRPPRAPRPTRHRRRRSANSSHASRTRGLYASRACRNRAVDVWRAFSSVCATFRARVACERLAYVLCMFPVRSLAFCMRAVCVSHAWCARVAPAFVACMVARVSRVLSTWVCACCVRAVCVLCARHMRPRAGCTRIAHVWYTCCAGIVRVSHACCLRYVWAVHAIRMSIAYGVRVCSVCVARNLRPSCTRCVRVGCALRMPLHARRIHFLCALRVWLL